MTRTKLYLDTRAAKDGQAAPLKLAINRKSKTALISLDVKLLPTQWNARAEKVVSHPNRLFLNSYIARRKLDIDTLILKLSETGEIANMSATDIKAWVLDKLFPESHESDKSPLFAERMAKFTESKRGSTRKLYQYTYRRIAAYCKEFQQLSFEDITKEWLTEFDTYLTDEGLTVNARSVIFRNVRTVFNDAIESGITQAYPFRRFKIRSEATPKRSLSVEQLRVLFNAPTDGKTAKALDIFKLIFLLIGINIVDLCRLRIINDGRVVFHRSKTNRLYSIKVEPEAQEIINRHKGTEHLLDILDVYNDHQSYTNTLNKLLKQIGMIASSPSSKPIFPNLSTYWARHSWATIAASLDIPKETIAAALGHGGNTVTDIYIDFDRDKVDAANRRVIDWVFYGKR